VSDTIPVGTFARGHEEQWFRDAAERLLAVPPGTGETTPWQIVRAAHTELLVTDLDCSRHFYVDLLGLVVTEEDGDAIYLRGYEDRCHHNLVLRHASSPAVSHVAFRVWEAADLERLASHYTELGCPVQWLAAGEERGQGEALRALDPLGCPVEYFYAMEPADRLLQRFDLYRGPAIMRLDHVNLHIPDVAAGYRYYRNLGFRCSEYTIADPPDGRLWAAWMYRGPSVHDVAFTAGTGPRLHHIGFWVADRDSVAQACDILAGAGEDYRIERGPGRHGISNAFFLYLRDPDGHRLELFTGDYYTGDPDFEPIGWVLSDRHRQTYWGAPAPESWFEESSNFLDLEGKPVELEEREVIAA